LLLFRREDGAAYHFGDLRDDGISEGFKSVHPSGNPMSHSTQVGFRAPCCPWQVSASFSVFVAPRPLASSVSGLRPPLWSLVVGVGQRLRATSLSKFGNLSFALFPMFSAAIALQLRGVGHVLFTQPFRPFQTSFKQSP